MEEAFNASNLSTLDKLVDEIFTADYVLHDPGFPDVMPGSEGVKQFVRGALKNTPDIQFIVDDMIAEGDKVAIRWTVGGTDASTGKPTRLLVIANYRFAGGKIAEEWQLGVPAD